MATLDVAFAWESIDADACTSMLYFARRVLSDAMSTSMIRPFAASRLVFCAAALSFENWSLETDPPFSARSVATFCSACVKTATETSASSRCGTYGCRPNERTSPLTCLLKRLFMLHTCVNRKCRKQSMFY